MERLFFIFRAEISYRFKHRSYRRLLYSALNYSVSSVCLFVWSIRIVVVVVKEEEVSEDNRNTIQYNIWIRQIQEEFVSKEMELFSHF